MLSAPAPPPGRESGEVTKLYSPLYYYMGNRPGGPAREKLTGYTPPHGTTDGTDQGPFLYRVPGERRGQGPALVPVGK